MLWRLANHRDPDSLAARLRRRRRDKIRQVILSIPQPMSILNVGGGEEEMSAMGLLDEPGISFTVLNVKPMVATHRSVTSVVGDGCNMPEFGDGEFDFVFSNSVIEHVGDGNAVRRMANEIRRVGKRYYIQTPNRYFPIEPHFVFPLFQFLPIGIRVFLVRRFKLGWMPRVPDPAAAESTVRSINLLSKKQMKKLFPDAILFQERVCGLTKSIQCLKVTS